MRTGRENEACQEIGIGNTQVGASSARQRSYSVGVRTTMDRKLGPVFRLSSLVFSWTDMLVCTDSWLSSLTADPLVGSIATQYMTNRAEHDRMARQWTKRYAT